MKHYSARTSRVSWAMLTWEVMADGSKVKALFRDRLDLHRAIRRLHLSYYLYWKPVQ